jgi:hypothetical protein
MKTQAINELKADIAKVQASTRLHPDQKRNMIAPLLAWIKILEKTNG